MSRNKSLSLIGDGVLIARNKVMCGVSSRYGEAGSVWRIASTNLVVLWSRVKHMENSEVIPGWSIAAILPKMNDTMLARCRMVGLGDNQWRFNPALDRCGLVCYSDI